MSIGLVVHSTLETLLPLTWLSDERSFFNRLLLLLLIFIRTIPSIKAFCCTALFDLRLYVQSKQLRSCQDGLLKPNCSWASFPVAAYQYKVSILLPVTDNMLFLNQRNREYFSIKTCAGCEATCFCDYRPSYRVRCMTVCSLWPPNYLAVHCYLTFPM